ncbi:MAG: hypothetical protein HY707_10625 [Ignavibacteriae bacterium]|nr:hypothetical protein [Ignavibacteriota bacterium]
MPNVESYKIGDKIMLNDIADAPEGAWVIRETMQFLRTQAGHSIVSLTPIERSSLPVNKTTDRFTLVYAGGSTAEKSIAVAEALNAL